eukprot:365595-Chlamydomonas_euryale.AAC.18
MSLPSTVHLHISARPPMLHKVTHRLPWSTLLIYTMFHTPGRLPHSADVTYAHSRDLAPSTPAPAPPGRHK